MTGLRHRTVETNGALSGKQLQRLPELATDLRGSVMLEGCGHWTQQERPAEVNRTLLDFLQSL